MFTENTELLIANSVARYGCVKDAPPPSCVESRFTLRWKHPEYHSEGDGTPDFAIRNDVALLKLNDGFESGQFPPGVGTICLPAKSMPMGEEVTVLGWGGMNSIEEQSPVLKEV